MYVCYEVLKARPKGKDLWLVLLDRLLYKPAFTPGSTTDIDDCIDSWHLQSMLPYLWQPTVNGKP